MHALLFRFAAVAGLVLSSACEPPDEHCALVPCSKVCLQACAGDAGSSDGCSAAVAACEASEN